ncbi:MAG: DoxX family protein [Candidatus Nanopelagicales bacterium]|nr:DoxX family protein [Candidatus Nanopelagicales bacterium]
MHVFLWILTGIVAAAFLAAGAMKLLRPRASLINAGMGWVEDFPQPGVRAIGAAEVLGAIGLVLPGLVGTAPQLVPIAATCLGIVMLGAVVVHLRRHESFLAPAVLLVACAVIAWGRFGPYALTN